MTNFEYFGGVKLKRTEEIVKVLWIQGHRRQLNQRTAILLRTDSQLVLETPNVQCSGSFWRPVS